MAIISGRLAFNADSKWDPSMALPAPGIQNVPIVLQNTTTGVGATALTDISGNFTFNNVPNGSYRLVEAWGQAGGTPTPVDFSGAVVIPQPTPADPPISVVTSPPAEATRLHSLTPNTLFLTVVGDMSNQNFVDAAITEVSLIVNTGSIVSGNLITAAQDGMWGTLPAGTAANTLAPVEPYPGVVPSETFSNDINQIPFAGVYIVPNIAYLGPPTEGAWFSMANHTTFDETSRFMVVNGQGGGLPANERIFATTVSVNPNSFYVGSYWGCNVDWLFPEPGTEPQLAVRISTVDATTILFVSPTQPLPYTNIPTWVNAGGVFNSGNNTALLVEYQSITQLTAGNDYAADDFALNPVIFTTPVTISKQVNKAFTTLGDILTYTITLSNSSAVTINSILFQDTIPVGASFVPGSVVVNNVSQPGFNPNPGFSIGTIAPNATSTVSFNVTVVSIPSNRLITNNSRYSFFYAPIEGQATIPDEVVSNFVNTQINNASIVNINKSVDKSFGTCGEIITYVITLPNTGNVTATNVIVSDTVPNGTTFIPGSILVNGLPAGGTPSSISIGTIAPGASRTVSFRVQVQC